MDSPDLTIEVPAPDAALVKLKAEEEAQSGSRFGVARGPAPGDGEPLAPSSGQGSDAPAPGTQADPALDAPSALTSAPAAASAVAAHLGLAGVEAALAGEGEPEHPPLGPPAAPTPAVAPPSGAAGTPAGVGGEEDELAANLLSNMASWQSELDAFQAALRRCMETRPGPNPAGSPSTVDASGRGAARLQHSGPKGVTGFRGVTQHKRTKRYEANVWMDHKQMYLGAFDVPEQAAHAHDIGALCSGKARPEALNFPLTDYETLLPMLHTLPHAQIVGALRSYGRLPTARPQGGVSSGRHHSSASARSAAARRSRTADSDDSEDDGAVAPKSRPRRARKPGAGGGRSAQALPRLPPAAKQEALGGWQGAAYGAPGDSGATGGAGSQPLASDAQHADLQALEAALMGSALASVLKGDDDLYVPEPPPRPRAKNSAYLAAFEGSLCFLMAKSHTLARPPPEEEGAVPRPLHSGPKGQSGFKGVTLYKRCQRYNAHIWLGKQTHIGTFHTAAQAAVAHDVMELWRNPQAQGLNFTAASYEELLPLMRQLSEADALNSLRNYSRSPTSAAAAAAAGVDVNRPRPVPAPRGAGPTAAKAKPSPGPPAPPGPPSLRRRQRKPQPNGSGSTGQRSDGSSGGAAAPPRFSAGSRMWYMLEQEKSVDDSEDDSMEDGESGGDSDFAPGEGDEENQQQPPTKRRRSQSPAGEPLAFQPRSTASVAAALASPVPPDQQVVGARPPRPGSSHRWGLAISMRGQAAWFGRIDRQRAAVAADLALIWRRCLAAAAGEEPDAKDAAAAFNVPSAGYEQDAALMDQIRRIRTAPQLGQFLAAVVPQDPPAAPGTAAAAAAASSLVGAPGQQGAAALAPPPVAPAPPAPSLLLGARKRKQQALLEEARAAGQQDGDAAAAAAPAADAGPLAQAAAAMAAADTGDSASMLAALRQLAAAGVGGQVLRDVVAGWEGYPLMQQQDMFGALKLPAASGDWDQLEGRLQVALDLASLF